MNDDSTIILLSLLFLFSISFAILVIIASLSGKADMRRETRERQAIYFLAIAGTMFSFLEMLLLLLTDSMELNRVVLIMGTSLIIAAFMTVIRKIK